MVDTSELDGLLILGVALVLATIASGVRGMLGWAKRDELADKLAAEEKDGCLTQRRAA